MAGDWIKVEKATPRKPEVLRVAAELGIRPDEAFGLCFRFWAWCDDHLKTGNAPGVSETLVDALVDRSGFASALITVGWLQARNGSLVIPNFDRHVSQSAKSRALTSERVAKCKQRKGNAANVSDALPREEKRREENIDTSNDVSIEKSARQKFVPPSVEDVRAYCEERSNKVDAQVFVNFYASKGWKVGANKMVDWKACVHTWEKNDARGSSSQKYATQRVGPGQRYRE